MKNKFNNIRFLFAVTTLFCITNTVQAESSETYFIPASNPLVELSIIDNGKNSFDSEQKKSIIEAAKIWSNVIKNPQQAATFKVIADPDPEVSGNAAGISNITEVKDETHTMTFVNARTLGKTIAGTPDECDAKVIVGLSDSWILDTYTKPKALHHSDNSDFTTIIVHEIEHTLGVRTSLEDGQYTFAAKISNWDKNIAIYKSGTEITVQPNMTIKADEDAPGEFDVVNNAPYYKGDYSLKVLGDSDDLATAINNIRNNVAGDGHGLVHYSSAYSDTEQYPKRPAVFGLPLEGDGADLGHIELRNNLMSHQNYRNWITFMEAELASIKDLGYDIDLKKHFGKSYYLNNLGTAESPVENNNGYWERNDAGTAYLEETPSTADYGIGLHLYGDNNYIKQNADIMSVGAGVSGARIEGVENNFTLNAGHKINTDGSDSLGIAVTYGKNHNITVSAGSEVTAKGNDGRAISFDFGENILGNKYESQGSYAHFGLLEDDSSDDESSETYQELPLLDDINGPLVKTFNLNGYAEGKDAAIYISRNAHVEKININNGSTVNGDIISNWDSQYINTFAKVKPDDGQTKYTELNFNNYDKDFENNITGSAINNTLKMKVNGTLGLKNSNISVHSLNNEGDINIKQNVSLTAVEDTITGNGNLNVLSGASLGLSSNITNIENTVNLNNASLDTANGSIDSTTFSKLTLSGNNNSMKVDVDFASQTSDNIKFNDPADLTVNPGASLKISNVNILNEEETYNEDKYYIPFISSANNNQNLLGSVSFTGANTILTPIFKYNLGYTEDASQGGFLLAKGAEKDYNSYNPAVTIAPVAAQFGGYLNQLNSYEQAFQNLDMKMLMTREERQAYKMANLYASTVTPTVYSPTYLPEKDKGAWFRPYATFEKADLRNGPKVESISYGSFFGGDSPVFETKNGWDYQFSLYAGYNGSHQRYSGNSIYQNGGTLGATGIWYKDNFFTSLTANTGASVADASTMYGKEDMTMLMAGIASKTGYNWELLRGKFIIQPSYLMSYSFVNTFDYTNAAGVRINSDPLNAINIAPGLKFIGNLENGWQPYIGMQMVWNIMDKTDFKANDVALPDMSVKPYFQYGVGVQKRWGERFTGFFQTMIRNGGRNGVAISLGFRWALGK